MEMLHVLYCILDLIACSSLGVHFVQIRRDDVVRKAEQVFLHALFHSPLRRFSQL